MVKFVTDFVGVFVVAALCVVYSVANFAIHACQTVHRFYKNVVIPMVIELGADLHFMMLIMLQAWYDVSGRACTTLSKWLIAYARYCVRQSEQLIFRTWNT